MDCDKNLTSFEIPPCNEMMAFYVLFIYLFYFYSLIKRVI